MIKVKASDKHVFYNPIALWFIERCILFKYSSDLTIHNWKKWKGRFLACPWQKIYRRE